MFILIFEFISIIQLFYNWIVKIKNYIQNSIYNVFALLKIKIIDY